MIRAAAGLRAVGLGVAMLGAAVLVAGCSSSGGASSTGSAGAPASTAAGSTAASSIPPVPSSSAVAPSSVPVTSVPASSAATSSTPASNSSSAAPTTSTPPAPSGPPACRASQVTATGVRGGAYQGREIAGVVFTNSSSSTCTMRGYVSAQLQANGAALGRPATQNAGTIRTVTLGPGQAAQVQLTAISTCQGANSDHVRVTLPGDSVPIEVAVQLRACALSVDPIEGS